MFWDLGGFDEAFPYAGAEDQALSLEARAAGLPLVRNHGMRVRHNDRSWLPRILRSRRGSAQTFVVSSIAIRGKRRAHCLPNVPPSRGLALERDQEDREVVAKSKERPARPPRACGAAGEVAPERALRPAYRLLLGLHIHRGVRIALGERVPEGHPADPPPLRKATKAHGHRQVARAKRTAERLGLTRKQ